MCQSIGEVEPCRLGHHIGNGNRTGQDDIGSFVIKTCNINSVRHNAVLLHVPGDTDAPPSVRVVSDKLRFRPVAAVLEQSDFSDRSAFRDLSSNRHNFCVE
jgi:hypothetical protein